MRTFRRPLSTWVTKEAAQSELYCFHLILCSAGLYLEGRSTSFLPPVLEKYAILNNASPELTQGIHK